MTDTDPKDTSGTATGGTGNDSAPSAPEKGRGVHLTERAAKEIRRIFDEQKFGPEVWVRIGAKGGGCSGFSYVLDFDKSGPTEFDLSYEMFGVRYCVDKKSEFFMGGTTLDFNDGLLDRGFVFQNPQAKGTCGCGTSFST